MSENETNITMESELMRPLRTDIDSIISKTLKTMHTYGNHRNRQDQDHAEQRSSPDEGWHEADH